MLNGIRIVEFEGLGPGPFAGMTLADLGADVIVIHRKGGGGVVPDGSVLDRGKRSIALDLKDPDDITTARALIASADGLIEGLRPGVMERLGLGPDDAHRINPALVYGRMTGWGQDGPKSHMAGHDLNYIATSGALWYAGLPGQPPVTPVTLVGDIGGGALYLVVGLLSGILNAQATGKGTVVDAAIVDGSAHMLNLLMAFGQAGGLREERGQSLLDGPHWTRSYACSDGGYVSVQCLEPQFYAEFLRLMSLADNPVFAQQHHKSQWADQTAQLAQIFAEHPRDHWAALFEGTDACVAPIYSPQEAGSDPHVAARAIWHDAPKGQQSAPAPRFDGAHLPVNAAPSRGQHSDEIRAELVQT